MPHLSGCFHMSSEDRLARNRVVAGCDCPHLAFRELLLQGGGPRLALPAMCWKPPRAGAGRGRGGTSLAAPSSMPNPAVCRLIMLTSFSVT